ARADRRRVHRAWFCDQVAVHRRRGGSANRADHVLYASGRLRSSAILGEDILPGLLPEPRESDSDTALLRGVAAEWQKDNSLGGAIVTPLQQPASRLHFSRGRTSRTRTRGRG